MNTVSKIILLAASSLILNVTAIADEAKTEPKTMLDFTLSQTESFNGQVDFGYKLNVEPPTMLKGAETWITAGVGVAEFASTGDSNKAVQLAYYTVGPRYALKVADKQWLDFGINFSYMPIPVDGLKNDVFPFEIECGYKIGMIEFGTGVRYIGKSVNKDPIVVNDQEIRRELMLYPMIKLGTAF